MIAMSDLSQAYEYGYQDGIASCKSDLNNLKDTCGSLQQRYEQLELIAKSMCKCLELHAYDWTQVSDETAKHYREQLKELGVNVDD